jgi:hypothetical protein
LFVLLTASSPNSLSIAIEKLGVPLSVSLAALKPIVPTKERRSSLSINKLKL